MKTTAGAIAAIAFAGAVELGDLRETSFCLTSGSDPAILPASPRMIALGRRLLNAIIKRADEFAPRQATNR